MSRNAEMKMPRATVSPAPETSGSTVLDDLAEPNVGLMVRYTFRSFTRILQVLVAPYGLTAAEFRVLRTLATGGALSQMQISTLAGMDRPYAALIAKQLRTKGLVEADADPRDGRRVRMSLSAEGRATTDRIAAQLHLVNVAAVAGVSPKELATFAKVITRITDNLDRMEQERGIPI